MLAQFAVGEIYSRVIFKNAGSRVGLLSIGEEEHKGNELTKAATLLEDSLIHLPVTCAATSIPVPTWFAMVLSAMRVLKVSEGLADMIRTMLKEAFTATGRCANWARNSPRLPLPNLGEARGLSGVRAYRCWGPGGRQYYFAMAVST